MRRGDDQLIDDLDGGPATQTVTFGLDGVAYSVDVSDEHAQELRGLLAPYIASGRRLGRYMRTGPASPAGRVTRGELDAVRDWARAHGYPVGSRGPIPRRIAKAYLEDQRGFGAPQ